MASESLSAQSLHQTVLYHETITSLRPSSPGKYVDATLGAGGHAIGILKTSSPEGVLLGLDLDAGAIKFARKRLKKYKHRAILQKASFADMTGQVKRIGWHSFNGIIFDLGMSSMQVDTAVRGFSFLKNGPLDMRFDQTQEVKAADLINKIKEDELARIIHEYGEEPKARKIAKSICCARPLHSTLELTELIKDVYRGHRGHNNPATRTFQAIRIAVNEELLSLQSGIEQAINLLEKGGRIAVISFHSLEDRIVKQMFLKESKDCLCPPEQLLCTCKHKAQLKILTKHPIIPFKEEITQNPRARSAKLRVAEKIV
ncbi:MAG TPA: 16S rRNA (cytosine(1402)-N(4))-methyltransferase RsmH [Anaerolineae bacterium]|nr:16S rRNA (cytosine(1402)-N(4))-methyltransferase RsmH [Anaerolineae bacterium]